MNNESETTDSITNSVNKNEGFGTFINTNGPKLPINRIRETHSTDFNT